MPNIGKANDRFRPGTPPKRLSICKATLFLLAIVITPIMAATADTDETAIKGIGLKPTGLKPAYPGGFVCSQLTSLYASWIDVDGTRRSEAHSGVDGGKLGDTIHAPGPGRVVAAWKTNFGWGQEASLLILHSREDLNMSGGAPYYYSEFDHLRWNEVKRLQEGDRIERGQVIGRVTTPGSNRIYLPEVHWEIYEVDDPDEIEWVEKSNGLKYFLNKTAELIDPLYMLGRHRGIHADKRVEIAPFFDDADYSRFKGFTYILPCRPR
ncbi:M23 family metallopeptidase [Rhodomicrobium vannielii ATCC 17100]|nr:M23 family metallopeptidase [Rhodomicrobium vannielii ATCC 17100]